MRFKEEVGRNRTSRASLADNVLGLLRGPQRQGGVFSVAGGGAAPLLRDGYNITTIITASRILSAWRHEASSAPRITLLPQVLALGGEGGGAPVGEVSLGEV